MTFLPETKKSEILTIHGRDALIYQPPRSRGLSVKKYAIKKLGLSSSQQLQKTIDDAKCF